VDYSSLEVAFNQGKEKGVVMRLPRQVTARKNDFDLAFDLHSPLELTEELLICEKFPTRMSERFMRVPQWHTDYERRRNPKGEFNWAVYESRT